MLRKKRVIKNRIIAGIVATVMAVSIVGGVLYFDSNEALAKPTLRGIEELVESHSVGAVDTTPTSFVILEVVPSLNAARMGYLVGGEEPVFEGKSIKDMPSRAERLERLDDPAYDPTGLDIYGGAFSWTTEDYKYKEADAYEDGAPVRTVEIKGDFKAAEHGWYNESDITSDYAIYDGNVEDLYDDLNTEGIVLYRKSDAYRISSGYTGRYSINIRKIQSAQEMPVETSPGIYNFQYFYAHEISEDTELSEGILLFYCDKDASGDYLQFAGMTMNDGDTLKVQLADDTYMNIGTGEGELYDPALNRSYYTVQESSEITSDAYRIDVVSDGGPFGVKSGYTRVEGNIYNSDNCNPSQGPYYVADGESDAYTYINDRSGSYDFEANYGKSDIYQTVKYLGGFKNNEWFKQYVLDREPGKECENLIVDVVPVTIDQLGSKLDSADLVYFAGDYAATDITNETAINVVNKVAKEDLPVILEYSTYNEALNYNLVNLQKMALCLMQGAISPIADKDAWANLNISDLLKTVRYYNADPVKNDISYVSGTIFVNDDIADNTTKVVSADFNDTYGKVKRETNFKDIIDEYESEKTYIELYDDWSKFNVGVSKATSIRYILNAHKNRAVIKGELKILDIEPYATSQYTDQSVLETNFWKDGNTITDRYSLVRDTMTADWMVTNLTEHLKGKEDKIHIKQLGTKEFIGKNEDLNATYDMIYIGMDTALMNTSNIGNAGVREKSTNTVYNFYWYFGDQRKDLFNNRVYLHVGDRIKTNFGWGDTPDNNYHLAGNDITSDKYRELKEYIEAGYAVILSDGFFDLTKAGVVVNPETLDSTSNLCKLIKEVVLEKDSSGNYKYYGKSVFRRGALEKTTDGYERARSTISKYLNISKLTVTAEEVPVAYNGTDNKPHYIQTNADGSHTLKFVVKLSNDAAVDASNTTYDCKLYLDMDADGKYEEGEVLGGLEIDGNSAEKFELKSGNTYTITRNAPDDYVGFLSWKLAFIQNEKETDSATTTFNNVRSAITGFSAIKNEGDKPVIKILQIAPNGNQTNNLDLTSEAMTNLYNQVTDFTIEVTKIPVADYIQKKAYTADFNARDLTYFDYLSKYDMVVIGFTDYFDFSAPVADGKIEVNYPVWWNNKYSRGNNPRITASVAYKDALMGIREYALSGRSILFTHDLTSRIAFSQEESHGYWANKYLRDIMGMDRYKDVDSADAALNHYEYDYMIKLEEYSNTLDQRGLIALGQSYRIPEYKSQYDFYTVDSNPASEHRGFSEANILRSATGIKWGLTTRKATSSYNVAYEEYGEAKVPNFDSVYRETVTAINEGQITQYPFLITSGTDGETDTDHFDVSSTHSQYFQLNLDTDSRDENVNDDVVVWYTISNRGASDGRTTFTSLHEYYQATYNDVRNNYYIYSKGNVMYTGAGHSPVKSDEERKLFVNTLVAAYNSGMHSPKVIFKENPWDSAVTITGTSLPYDPRYTNTEALTDKAAVEADEGKYIVDTLNVNFKTLNNNFRESKDSLHVNYYLAAPDGGTIIDGVAYKKLEPLSIQMDNGAGKLVAAPGAHLLANYKIYQVKFNLADLAVSTPVGKLKSENATIYVRISTEPIEDESKLAACESMNAFTISTMKLFDLK